MVSAPPRPVTPGDMLGVAEEWVPGYGVYIDSEGYLRASVAGVAEYDVRSRVVRVRPSKPVKMPMAGSSVVGVVYNIGHDVVMLDILGEVSLQPSPKWRYEYSGDLSGGIPISMITKEYVKDINDYYRIGDIVLARVLNNKNPYHLTTKPPQYGVIYARCSRCGTLLEPVNPRSMKCPKCGNVEKRKVSVLASSKLLRINLRRSLIRYLS